ncbi:MAG TPA: glycosyltransferase [Chitinophagaceae bacterium]|nr:glycosyltransferase [Chitinophagaceae bacterium]
MSPKHIVHIIFSLQTGGAENLMVDVANGQSKHHNVSIIIINKDYDHALLQRIHPSIKTILINRKKGSRGISKILLLHKHLYFFKPNIIHCHNHNIINILLLYRKRTVYTIHDVGISMKYFKKYKQLVAISEAVYDDVVKRSNKMLQPTIINNAIRIEAILCRQAFQLHQPIQIIQISRLMHEKKGQDILLYAIVKLLQDNPSLSVKISFVGIGTSLSFLQNLAQDLALNNYVDFLMQKDRKWIYANLCNYDMLVQPSRYEGFGLTIIEAMAAKLPVIATNIDGPALIIDKEQYGYLFEKENINNLSDKIIQVINDYNCNTIANKISSARQKVELEYSMSALLNKYEAVYNAIY